MFLGNSLIHSPLRTSRPGLCTRGLSSHPRHSCGFKPCSLFLNSPTQSPQQRLKGLEEEGVAQQYTVYICNTINVGTLRRMMLLMLNCPLLRESLSRLRALSAEERHVEPAILSAVLRAKEWEPLRRHAYTQPQIYTMKYVKKIHKARRR